MFDCLEVAHEAVRLAAPLVRAVAKHDKALADQLRRACNGIVSNIDEGAGHLGANRTNYYRHAQGSTREVMTQLRLAAAWDYVGADAIAPVLALLDRVRAMLWRLTH
jgi:four helix bundle protein